MTPSPSSYSYSGTTTRTRVKWDNIAIVLVGAVVAAFAVVMILTGADKTPPTKPAAKPAPVQSSDQIADTTDATDELTLEDATSLAEEAKQFIAQARWDEAADRLDTIPEEFRATVDADAIEAQLTDLRAQSDKLRAELTAAVEAHQFKEAKTILAKLAKIAPLDADLLQTQAQVTSALGGGAAKPDATKTPAKPAAGTSTHSSTSHSGTSSHSTSTSGGGATSGTTTHHNSTTTTHHASGGGTTTRPSGGSTSNTSGAPTVTVNGQEIDINALGSMNLSNEELEAALAQLGVSDLSELGLS